MDDRRLRIGLSIYMFKPGTGGLQSHAEQLCRHLQARGHEVTVVTRAVARVPEFMDYLYFNEPGELPPVNGVRVRPLRFSRAWRPVQWFLSKCVHRPVLQSLGIRLYEMQGRTAALQAFDGFDIIHHVGQATALIGFAASIAAKNYHIPFVVQPTCHPHHVGDSPLDLRLYAKADRLLVHTQYEGEHLRRAGIEVPYTVVGNGIEDRADGQGERFRSRFGISGPIVLYIGRKDADKGYPLVVEAFKGVRSRRPDAALVCMGPPGEARIEASTGGLVDLDFVSEELKHDALAACTCLCVPSEGESFGLVYMEAGRYGKAVIGRRLPVLKELLSNGNAGVLLGTLDRSKNEATLEVAELQEAILRLLSDPGECRRLGEAIRRVSENFVWARVVQRFEEAYYEVLAQAIQGGRRALPTGKVRCDR
jgi:glycosyltransferase involved in cell wall biosynthesis